MVGRQEVELLRSKYSESCEIPSRAGYNSIREGRACFSTASPRKDQAMTYVKFHGSQRLKVRSLSLGIVYAGGEQWVDRTHTGPVDPLENSNGHKLAPIMRAASYSTIGFLGFFSRPVRECARTSLHGVSHGTLSREF